MSFDGQSGSGRSYGGQAGESAGGRKSVPYGAAGDVSGEWTPGARKGKRMSTTQSLAKRHGVKNSRIMYVRITDLLHWGPRILKSASKIRRDFR